MARWTWQNVSSVGNNSVTMDDESGPGGQVIADCSLDGVYQMTLVWTFLKEQIAPGHIAWRFDDFPTRAQALQGQIKQQGTRVKWSVSPPVESDQTAWPVGSTPGVDGTAVPGATITGNMSLDGTLQGTLTLVVVLDVDGVRAWANFVEAF